MSAGTGLVAPRDLSASQQAVPMGTHPRKKPIISADRNLGNCGYMSKKHLIHILQVKCVLAQSSIYKGPIREDSESSK